MRYKSSNKNYFSQKPTHKNKTKQSASLDQILKAYSAAKNFHAKLAGYRPSPLYTLKNLATQLGLKTILIKNEGERFGICALKMLGASYAMQTLLEKHPGILGFCTATDGNHGRSVAWSARHLKKPATIFVPSYTVEERIEKIRKEGAEVITIRENYDDSVTTAKEFAKSKSYCLVQDMAWDGYEEIPALIMAGYYTQMQEVVQQMDIEQNPVDLIILQSGNGSWPAAVTHFVRNHSLFRNTKILIVEPSQSDCMLESLKQGKRCSTMQSQETIMAGLNCGTPSSLAWDILSSEIDAAISIDDSYARDAVRRLYHAKGNDACISAGESGAAGLAGLLAIQTNPAYLPVKQHLELDENSNVLIFNTEGVTDHKLFQELIR